MLRRFRVLHRWLGLGGSIFLAVISLTGFLLAIKKRSDWIQPATSKRGEVTSLAEVVSLDQVGRAAFALGLPELKGPQDVNRFELHADKGIFKITSHEGYREVQVDARTARVLSTGVRRDQFFESLHDLSFFSDAMRDWVLPAVAIALFGLGVSGIAIVAIPAAKRRAFYKSKRP